MTMPTKPTLLVLIALLACSACTSQQTTHASNDGALQLSSIRWDEAISASKAARVSNGSLILMR